MISNHLTPKENDPAFLWNRRSFFSRAPAIGALFQQLFPNICPTCARRTPPQYILCGRCIIELLDSGPCTDSQEGQGPIRKLWYYSPYQSIIGTLIRKYKYDAMMGVERILAYCIIQILNGLGSKGIFVIPIPPHPAAVRNRGFSHTLLLLQAAKRMGLSHLQILPWLRHRAVPYRPQASIQDHQRRRENVAGAFAPNEAFCHIEHVILFDDVYTSGATMEEAALAIGVRATTIDAVVLAKTLPAHRS